MSIRSARLLLLTGMVGALSWTPPRYTQGIENKVAQPGAFKFGAKSTTYAPSPGGPARGKRRRQWR